MAETADTQRDEVLTLSEAVALHEAAQRAAIETVLQQVRAWLEMQITRPTKH
jgi:hypothetical protein